MLCHAICSDFMHHQIICISLFFRNGDSCQLASFSWPFPTERTAGSSSMEESSHGPQLPSAPTSYPLYVRLRVCVSVLANRKNPCMWMRAVARFAWNVIVALTRRFYGHFIPVAKMDKHLWHMIPGLSYTESFVFMFWCVLYLCIFGINFILPPFYFWMI